MEISEPREVARRWLQFRIGGEGSGEDSTGVREALWPTLGAEPRRCRPRVFHPLGVATPQQLRR